MELRCLTDDAALVRAVQKLNLGILPVQPPVFCYRRAAKDTHCLSWAAMISDGGAVCGAVIADLELERSGHRTVQLRTLAVPTQFRRQGIGKKLVLKVIQQAKKAEEDTGEIDAVRLHVHTENDGALAFYKALGFVEKDRVEDYYRHLEPRTAFVMEYSLHL